MSFGATVDHFALADTQLLLQSSSKTPNNQNAQALGDAGDVECETVFEEYFTYSCEYKLSGGLAFVLDTSVQVGDIISDIVVTAIDIATSNTDRPTITVSGTDFFGDDAEQPTYSSGLTIQPTKTAQDFDAIVLDADSRLNTGSIAISSQESSVMDAVGARAAVDIYQERVEFTAELVSCTAIATATADTGWTAQPAGSNTENAGYGGGNITVFKNVSRDVA